MSLQVRNKSYTNQTQHGTLPPKFLSSTLGGVQASASEPPDFHLQPFSLSILQVSGMLCGPASIGRYKNQHPFISYPRLNCLHLGVAELMAAYSVSNAPSTATFSTACT